MSQDEYKTKTSKILCNRILVETFDDDNEFYAAIEPEDMLISDTKKGIIFLLNCEANHPDIHIGVWLIKFKERDSIKEHKKKIIKYIKKELDDFKWIRISYIPTEWTDADERLFNEIMLHRNQTLNEKHI